MICRPWGCLCLSEELSLLPALDSLWVVCWVLREEFAAHSHGQRLVEVKGAVLQCWKFPLGVHLLTGSVLCADLLLSCPVEPCFRLTVLNNRFLID